MNLLEEYYELSETEHMSAVWLVLQIVSYIGVIVFGLWCAWYINFTAEFFAHNCFLHANLSLVTQSDSVVTFQPAESVWGYESDCEYSDYSFMCSFIFGFIWLTFFCVAGKGGKSYKGFGQPWRIVFPAMIFNFAFFLITIIAAIKVASGVSGLCNNFDQVKNKQLFTDKPCYGLQNITTIDNHKNPHIYHYITWMSVIAYMEAVSWFAGFIILLLRILLSADFVVYKVAVYDTERSTIEGSREPKKVKMASPDEPQPSTSKEIPTFFLTTPNKEKLPEDF